MDSVSYRMAGAGNWQIMLPDEETRRLYARLYPTASLRSVDSGLMSTIASWQEAGIAAVTASELTLLGPLMTDGDLSILEPWFDGRSAAMSQPVKEHLPDYREMAEHLGAGLTAREDMAGNLITILACAQALDMETFRILRRDLLGRHPSRGPAGNLFFWGYAFAGGPRRIFGVTTYGRAGTARVSVLRSHGLKRGPLPDLLRQRAALSLMAELCGGSPVRESTVSSETQALTRRLRDAGLLEADDPPRLAVPVLSDRDLEQGTRLNSHVAGAIADAFTAGLGELQELVPRCSFAACALPDILCMIFHLAYSYCADALVGTGMIPDFPREAGGEWGVWMHGVGDTKVMTADRQRTGKRSTL